MTRTIDAATLELTIVRHCSPTLAAIKPASLFTFPGRFVGAPDANARRSAFEKALEQCGAQVAGAGISLRVLAWRDCGALVYVYRADALAAYLADPRAARPLARAGYDTTSLSSCIRTLAARLQARTGRTGGSVPVSSSAACPCANDACRREFPHELGFFLGYPYADVAGFIRHRGRDYLTAGPWKVYADLEGALDAFERLRRCAADYMRAHQAGCTLAQLAVACG